MTEAITRVGFFHFGRDHEIPVSALEGALQEAFERFGRMADSLIVLPESFNLGQEYWHERSGGMTPATTPAILDDLKRLSAEFGCAFIAGLTIADCPNISPPYSSAYLIDHKRHLLLSRKHRDDGSANYTPFPTYNSQPVVWRQLGIVALICMDSYEGTCRFESLAAALGPCRERIVCIPMHMSNGLGDGRAGHTLTSRYGLSDAVWVAANSHTGSVQSFIADQQGLIREPARRGPINAVEILPLADLAAPESLQLDPNPEVPQTEA